MPVTGLIYFDGGVLDSDHELQAEYNEAVMYQDSTLPGFGLAVQGASYLASGFDIYATMVSNQGDVVFVNRAIDLTTRRSLDPNYPNDDPVFILWWASGDVAVSGTYYVQFKAIDRTAITGVEYFKEITISILPRLASGGG